MVRTRKSELDMRWRRGAAAVAAAAVLLTGAVACSSEGADTRCSLNDCTVTFDRGVEAQVDVLGVEVKLVDVKGDQATVEVAGEKLVLAAGADANAGGFQVTVQEITDKNVVVKIARAE